MKYCSNCGSSNLEFMIPEHDNIKRYCCQDCSSIFYTNPNNVVGALCIRDKKIFGGKTVSIFGGGDSALDWAVELSKNS